MNIFCYQEHVFVSYWFILFVSGPKSKFKNCYNFINCSDCCDGNYLFMINYIIFI